MIFALSPGQTRRHPSKFSFKEAKMFPNKFRNILVIETMFPSLLALGNKKKTLMGNSGQTYFLACLGLYTFALLFN